MDTRYRTRPLLTDIHHGSNGDLGGTARSREDRAAAARLAAEADATIDEVLSVDSASYLGSLQQRSGE